MLKVYQKLILYGLVFILILTGLAWQGVIFGLALLGFIGYLIYVILTGHYFYRATSILIILNIIVMAIGFRGSLPSSSLMLFLAVDTIL